jgi:acetoin utilization deacetylase AcuC-like enzyme
VPVHIFWHPSSLDHDPGFGHPESPERLRAVLDALRALEPARALAWHEAQPAEASLITKVHPQAHLDRLLRLAERGGGVIDGDTAMSRGSFHAAVCAAGAASAAVDYSLRHGTHAYVPVRPPGHHATAEVAMGFCLLNNVVVAANAALDVHGAERVLIVDWDVHHGNGTQNLVDRDPRIRYISLHQWPLYPGTGREGDRGVGNIFNIPRPPGLPRGQYVADLLSGIDSATHDWRPDLVLVSAGFDALAGDPLAGFTLEPEDYPTWVEALGAFGAPLVAVLEGGYVPERLAVASEAVVRALHALG